MIDQEHGLKATIAAGGIAVLTACCLFAVKPAAVADTGSSAGEPAISQDAAAQEEQPEENTAAAQEGQPEENTAAAQEGQPVNPEAYEEREVPVFRETATEEKITLRFYEDMPHVAYVNIADYHHLYLPQAEVTSEKTGEGSSAYLVRIDTGSAVIDTEKETLTSDDYLEFTNVMGQTQPGMRNAYLDGIPYVRWSSEEATPAQVPVELDYSKYGIDLRADDSGVYLPIATLSDLYADLAYHFAFFDGTKVYVENENWIPAFFDRDPEYYDNIFREEERPEDLAAFTYGELCFAIDHFYGRPGRVAINDALVSKGFDGALGDYGADGEAIRKLLQSTDKAEYLYGLNLVGALLWDGGHTVINCGTHAYYRMPESMQAKYEAVSSKYTGLLPEFRQKARQDMRDYDNLNSARSTLREQAYGAGVTYVKEGDTAVCIFDSFMPYPVDSFKDYQSGKAKEMPEGDSMTVFLSALNKAKADPEIKYFVIDLSNNGGGSVDMLAAMIAFLTGDNKVSLYSKNMLTGQTITETYEVDTNLDGKFDDQDKGQPCDFHVAILTSRASFSCGNAFPAFMQEQGAAVVGERSGGGACAIQCMATPDGFWYQISSHRMYLTSHGDYDLDFGVPLDADLVGKNEDGSDKIIKVKTEVLVPDEDGSLNMEEEEYETVDYTGFYQIDKLREAISPLFEDSEEELEEMDDAA